ncbi:hypothetical protein L6164_006470 [Bauhinia variegata]|uniref:Uncharacterized protein n=1 Tax=Bauhinia variegata TaxID=167791 RepID=A0ACB9PTZ0_BAUVA|nr:hypothetical protein L6164_006470 [Bauhinia variegata]
MASHFPDPSSFPSMPLSYMIILFILLNVISSVHTFDYFSSCANQFSCGDLRNVGFPFWGDGRPEGCGYPDLYLKCTGNLTYITIKNISYLVKEVHPEKNTLKIARAEYSKGLCPSQFLNTNTDVIDHNLFDYLSGYQNLTLFYGCNVGFPWKILGLFDCPVNGVADTHAYPLLGAWVPIGGFCKYSVVVPVPSTFTVADLANLQAIGEAVKDGFEVKWTVGAKECNECLQSGGVCGYVYDLNKPTCYCKGSDSGSRVCDADAKAPQGYPRNIPRSHCPFYFLEEPWSLQ